jgi:putative copper export protein
MTVVQATLQWVDIVCTIVLAGGFIAEAIADLPSSRGRRLMRGAAGALAGTLLAELAITAARMAPMSSDRGFALVVEVLSTRWGWLWMLRAAGLGALSAGLAVRRRVGYALLAAVWLFARSLQGHAGAHGLFPALIDWLHLLAAVAWLGALIQLSVRFGNVSAAQVGRVRTLATVSVLTIVPSGLYAACLHVPDVDRLLWSPYGQTLVVKLGFVVPLLILGAINHFRLAPRLFGGQKDAARMLGSVVRVELVLAGVVLFCAALLGMLPMPHGSTKQFCVSTLMSAVGSGTTAKSAIGHPLSLSLQPQLRMPD